MFVWVYFCDVKNKYITMQVKGLSAHPTIQQLSDYDPDKKTTSVPLQFQFLPVEILSKQFTKLNNQHAFRIHYLGARPHNTLAFHKKYAYNDKNQEETAAVIQNKQYERYRVDMRKLVESYTLQEKLRGNSYYRSGLFYRAFEGMNPYLGEGEWIFNSLFEGGNLDCAIKIKENEFDLFLRVDANTKGHVQWFYFSVKNGCRKQKLKLNICNLSKGKSLYNSGLQPYVFSKQKNTLHGTQWVQAGVNLGINHKQLRYDYLDDKVPQHQLSFYCLELQYQFEHENDEVFFAYCIPFTFSRLVRQLSLLPAQWVKQGYLGKSLSGIDIPLLHISNHEIQKDKKNIFITGRWHPGQSNSSHMLQGFINFLISNSREAAELRNRLNFFIVPMANPDGVICGNNRTSMAGKDLNRQFIVASRELYPQVALVKQFAKKLQNTYGLFMYLDFHGHSRKKNTFFYGPSYSIHEPNYYKSRVFPKLIQKVDSNFRFHSCTFNIDEEKKSTARAVMFQHIKVPYTFTIETSIGLFYNCEAMKTLPFSENEWKTIGTSIAQGLSKFIIGFEQYQQIMRERRLSRMRKRPPSAGKHTFTENNNEDDDFSSYFKRGQPLRLQYKGQSLFGCLIDEIKSTKANQNYIKQIDEDYESDAHDETQQFETSKMKQFNNLLTDAARKDPVKVKKEPHSLRFHRQPEQLIINQQDLADELQFLEQLQAAKKSQNLSPTKEPTKPALPSASKTTANWRKTTQQQPGKRLVNQSQMNSRPMTQKNQIYAGRRSFDKKNISESQLGADNKISYFGQFRIFVDESQQQEKLKPFSRNSIFTREKNRSKKNSRNEDPRFMSQSILERVNRTTYVEPNLYQHNPPQMSKNLPKSNNFEFKFDQIQTANMTKQKLKDYLKTKVNRSSRSSTIGPASFYGVRQNINQKRINSRQTFMMREQSSSPRKQSIKIIKFV